MQASSAWRTPASPHRWTASVTPTGAAWPTWPRSAWFLTARNMSREMCHCAARTSCRAQVKWHGSRRSKWHSSTTWKTVRMRIRMRYGAGLSRGPACADSGAGPARTVPFRHRSVHGARLTTRPRGLTSTRGTRPWTTGNYARGPCSGPHHLEATQHIQSGAATRYSLLRSKRSSSPRPAGRSLGTTRERRRRLSSLSLCAKSTIAGHARVASRPAPRRRARAARKQGGRPAGARLTLRRRSAPGPASAAASSRPGRRGVWASSRCSGMPSTRRGLSASSVTSHRTPRSLRSPDRRRSRR